MDSVPANPPVPSAPPPPPSGPAPAPPLPPIQIIQRGPGFGRGVAVLLGAVGALTIVFGLGIIAGVAMIGIVGVWIGGATLDETVVWSSYRDGGARQVAVIPIRGVIDGRKAAFVRACVDGVIANDAVDAVVLRVDSPGGGVTASDQIWYEIERLKKERQIPVIASYGGVAASGGYYVSCGADFIMAQETCITGSIGVIAQMMTFEGLLDKVGVEPVTLVARRSPDKNVANDVFRRWSDADREQVLSMLDAAYDTFHRRVKSGRSNVITDPARLDELASGAVFTAQDALTSGLVDGIGYLDDAIAHAETTAGLRVGSATISMLYERPTLFDGLPFVDSGLAGGRAGVRAGAFDAEHVRSLINDLGSVRPMYLMR